MSDVTEHPVSMSNLTVTTLIDKLGGVSALAKRLDKKHPATVSRWQTHGIPKEHWDAIIKLAAEDGFTVTADQLHHAELGEPAPRKGRRRRKRRSAVATPSTPRTPKAAPDQQHAAATGTVKMMTFIVTDQPNTYQFDMPATRGRQFLLKMIMDDQDQ